MNINQCKIYLDLSEWNTNNDIEMFNLFSGCSSLLSIPDLSKWEIKK